MRMLASALLAASFRLPPPRAAIFATAGISPQARFSAAELDSARVKLEWEAMVERQAAPVLNLSRRERTVVPADEPKISQKIADDDDEAWDDGSLWDETRENLVSLKALSPDDEDEARRLLLVAPQLLRLEPAVVLEAARVVIDECGGAAMLVAEPRILTYRAADVRYGVKFLANMMMMDETMAVSMCKADPQMLIAGVDGGLQERNVAAALGAADAAGASLLGTLVKDVASAARAKRESRKRGL